MTGKLKSFITQCARVWKVLKKPSAEEYKTVAKVSALGVLLLGCAGFFISLVMRAVL